MVSLDVAQLLYELKTMHSTKTVKGVLVQVYFFQNSEHPRIDYFGYRT